MSIEVEEGYHKEESGKTLYLAVTDISFFTDNNKTAWSEHEYHILCINTLSFIQKHHYLVVSANFLAF